MGTPHQLNAPCEKNTRPLKSLTHIFLIQELVSSKTRNPLWFNLILQYSISFILFLDYCNPLTLFVKKVKLLQLVISYLLKTVSNRRQTGDNINMFYF